MKTRLRARFAIGHDGVDHVVGDRTLYRVLRAAARHGMLVLVHCENGDAVAERQTELVAAGELAPRNHAEARPPPVEAEATARAVALAELAEAPLYVVHVTAGNVYGRGDSTTPPPATAWPWRMPVFDLDGA